MKCVYGLAATALCLGLLAHAIPAAAQTTAEAPAAKGTRLVVLGTGGGPLPRKDRTQTSNLLVVNGALYVVDAGDNVTRRIVQAGEDFRKVGKIFITHPHSDHTMGLATLLVTQWEYQRREPIDVYGPPGTAALVKGAIDYLTVNAEIRWSEGKKTNMADIFHGHDVGSGVVYQDANVKVTAVENTHFHFQPGTLPYGKYKSYSYRFDAPDRAIVFTGDTGPSDAVTALAKGADVLVTETTSVDEVVNLYKRNGTWDVKTPDEQQGFIRHMKDEHIGPEEIGRMATAAGIKTVVMSHLGPSNIPNDDYQRFVDEAKKSFSGRIVVAKDLMAF
jgi:ribonuclease BN (tRNA processing enzyme)